MKRSSIFVLVGGALGLLAFFLPFFSITILGATLSASLLDLLNAAGQAKLGSDFAGQVALVWIEPVCAAILLLFALLADKIGKGAHGLNLFGALLGLGFLLYVFSKLQSLLASINGPAVGLTPTSLLGIGFWAAGVAFILGLVGAIMGLTEQPKVSTQSSPPLPTMSSQIARSSPSDQGNEPVPLVDPSAPTSVNTAPQEPSGSLASGGLPQTQPGPIGPAPRR